MRLFHSFLIAATLSGAAWPAFAQPQIVALSEHDEAVYRRAFSAADEGDVRAARAALRTVDDDALVGTALGRAYVKGGGRGSYGALVSWLNQYPDLGVAQAVYDRAQQIRPRTYRRRHRHRVAILRGPAPPSPAEISRRAYPRAPGPPPDDSASARAEVAALQDNLGAGQLDWRSPAAQAALQGPRSGQAAWVLGLAAFRAHEYADAVRLFDQSAAWPYHGPSASAGAHFWAARARLAAGEVRGVTAELTAAASYYDTFYGQLAEIQLGRDSALTLAPPELEADGLRVFMDRHPAARRAAALAQLGRLSDVEGELRVLHGQLEPREDRTYLALADALQAPSAQLRAADYGGPDLASGLCPTMSFAPSSGFVLDRALVYAVVRQESYFNPVAVSPSNARGLMQLLPSTATDMDPSGRYKRRPAALFDPSTNLSIGQNYLLWLMGQFHQDRDLGRIFAAYNGGPGWLQRWLASGGENADPLMVLETLPRAESRDYAERVLSHMGVCRRKFGQQPVEMQALATGRPAIYQPLDGMASLATLAASP